MQVLHQGRCRPENIHNNITKQIMKNIPSCFFTTIILLYQESPENCMQMSPIPFASWEDVCMHATKLKRKLLVTEHKFFGKNSLKELCPNILPNSAISGHRIE